MRLGWDDRDCRGHDGRLRDRRARALRGRRLCDRHARDYLRRARGRTRLLKASSARGWQWSYTLRLYTEGSCLGGRHRCGLSRARHSGGVDDLPLDDRLLRHLLLRRLLRHLLPLELRPRAQARTRRAGAVRREAGRL